MKKEDYLKALEAELGALPQAEKQEIMDYFTEYAADLGENANLLDELGQPAEVAKDLLTNLEIDWTGKQNLVELDPSVQSPIQHMLGQLTQVRSQTQAHKKELEPFDKIECHLSSVDLRILPSSDEHFYYSYDEEKNKSQLDLQVVDHKLIIRSLEDKKASGSSFKFKLFHSQYSYSFSSSADLTIYLPQGHELLEFTGKNDNGDIQLENLHVHTCQLALGSGDLDIQHCHIQTGKFENLDGDISLEQTSLKQGKITNTNGDCEFRHLALKETEITSLNGDVNLAHSMLKNTKIQLSNGDINLVNLGLLGSLTIGNSNGDTKLELTKEQAQQVTITAQLTWGDLTVNGVEIENSTFYHTGDKSQASLTLSNSNGDVSLYL